MYSTRSRYPAPACHCQRGASHRTGLTDDPRPTDSTMPNRFRRWRARSTAGDGACASASQSARRAVRFQVIGGLETVHAIAALEVAHERPAIGADGATKITSNTLADELAFAHEPAAGGRNLQRFDMSLAGQPSKLLKAARACADGLCGRMVRLPCSAGTASVAGWPWPLGTRPARLVERKSLIVFASTPCRAHRR